MTLERKTQFSDCRRYRFVLWRKTPLDGLLPVSRRLVVKPGFVQFIGLNPSTANETDNDMTITKCIGFATRWGYAEMCMTNLFTFISTDPRVLFAQTAFNTAVSIDTVSLVALEAALIVAAWGNDGGQFAQSFHVLAHLRQLGKRVHCLGKTSAGNPKHPSRIGYNAQLVEF
jgi:hypothetical protein